MPFFQTVTVEEPLEEGDEPEKKDDLDEDIEVEEAKDDDKPKTKSVEKTVWEWEQLNDQKPIWTRK